MIVGIDYGLSWLIISRVLAVIVPASTVFGGEVGALVDKRSGLGIGTGSGGFPECRAEVCRHGPEFTGIRSKGS